MIIWEPLMMGLDPALDSRSTDIPADGPPCLSGWYFVAMPRFVPQNEALTIWTIYYTSEGLELRDGKVATIITHPEMCVIRFVAPTSRLTHICCCRPELITDPVDQEINRVFNRVKRRIVATVASDNLWPQD